MTKEIDVAVGSSEFITDKDIEMIEDVTEENLSACCGAPIVMSFCTDCKEHAE